MSLLPTLVLLAPATAHLAAAATARHGERDAAWRRAEYASLLATLAAAAALMVWWVGGPTVAAGLRLDGPGALVALLVGFVGWVIVRFSRRYLQGERDERQYLALLTATLAAVSGVLVADHLLLLCGAWMATSLTLHRLLRFYPQRPAARLAAHKKYLSARLADVALFLAIALLASAYDTLSLQSMLDRAALAGMPPMAQAGITLLVLTALLKCAQMPLHGWLIQVMEAPTPVSALLHAGVVNLGGFVLIRFAPMLAEAPPAQILLAAVATTTVVLATLVTGTRISVKVMLAWSTVAQMGFMLLQIALGLPQMALLHLVAHSLYKAHAFLAAGGAVQRRQALRLAAPVALPGAGRRAVAAAVMLVLLVGGGALSGALAGPAALLAGGVLALTLAPLVASGHPVRAAALAGAWFAGHALAALLVPTVSATPWPLVVAAGVALAGLFGLQAGLALHPGAAWSRRLHPWAFAGFHLDDRISQGLLRRWPVPAAPVAPPTNPRAEGVHP